MNEALFEAIRRKNLPLCLFLLSHEELDINATDEDDDNFLGAAIVMNFTAFASHILKRSDFNVFLRNNYDDDALTIAIHKKNFQIFQKIVTLTNKNTGQSNINYQNNLGKTPLMICLQEQFDEGIQFLLQSQADVSLKDSRERTALHYAARYGSFETLVHLIACIRRMHPATLSTLINSKTKLGKTPLLCLIRSFHENPEDYLKKIQLLLKEPEINIHAHANNNKNCLEMALKMNINCETIKLLLKNGAKIDPSKVIEKTRSRIAAIFPPGIPLETSLQRISYWRKEMEQEAENTCSIIEIFSQYDAPLYHKEFATLLPLAIHYGNPWVVKAIIALGIPFSIYKKAPLLLAQHCYEKARQEYEKQKAIAEENNPTLGFLIDKDILERAQEIIDILTPAPTT